MLHAVKVKVEVQVQVQVQVEVKVGDAFAESRSFLALNTASKNQSAVLVCVDAIAKSHQTLVLKLVDIIGAEEMKGPAQIMLGPMKPCLVGSVLVSVETKKSEPRPDTGVKLTCNGRPIAPLATNGQYVDRPAKAFVHIQQE